MRITMERRKFHRQYIQYIFVPYFMEMKSNINNTIKEKKVNSEKKTEFIVDALMMYRQPRLMCVTFTLSTIV